MVIFDIYYLKPINISHCFSSSLFSFSCSSPFSVPYLPSLTPLLIFYTCNYIIMMSLFH